MSRPASNVRAADSGSNQMLNSAAGVTLPRPSPPPIIGDAADVRQQLGAQRREQRDVRERPDRCEQHRLVAALEDLGQQVDRVHRHDGRARLGHGRAAEAVGAVHDGGIASRRTTSGREAPAATGTSSRPASASTRSALRVVVSSGRLPATVVSASSSTSGLASASRIAIASSTPGSQSMTSGVATGGAV